MLPRRALIAAAPMALFAGAVCAQPSRQPVSGPSSASGGNAIRNSTMVGAVVGTPGTNPTNWSMTNNGGLTVSIIETGIEDGLSYIDYRFSGTPSGTSRIIGPSFETTASVTAVTGQTWTESVYYRLVGGTFANVTGIQLGMDEYTSVGGFITGGAATLTSPTGAALTTQRGRLTRTLSGGGTTAFILQWLRITTTAAVATDFTLRIGAPQQERGSFANAWVATSGVAVQGGRTRIGGSALGGPS